MPPWTGGREGEVRESLLDALYCTNGLIRWLSFLEIRLEDWVAALGGMQKNPPR